MALVRAGVDIAAIGGTAGSKKLSYYDIVPSDVADLPVGTVLVGINGNGTAGDIAIEQSDATTFTFRDLPAGGSFYSDAVKIKSTGTTATEIYIGVLA